MGEITSIAIQSAIVLALEYIIYKWALASLTFYRINRAIIMICYILALLGIPLLNLCSKWFASALHNGDIVLGQMAITLAPESEGTSVSYGLLYWIPIIYLSGVFVSAIMMLVSYFRLIKVIRKSEKIYKGRYTIVVSDTDVAPFSWGRYIVVSPEDTDNHIIFLHETAHIQFHHSFELLIANLFVIFNWFNPTAYLMRRELCSVQEYEADAQVLQSNVSVKDYQMLLIKKTAGSRFQAITNSLKHSQLKLRLTMMVKTKSKPARLFCVASLLPALLGAAAITSTPAIASAIKSVKVVSFSKDRDSEPNDQQTPLKVINVEPIRDLSSSNSTQEVFDQPEVLPQYKDGEIGLYRILALNMKYPKEAMDKTQQGKVLVKFNVNTDGTASDFCIEKSSGYESLDQEALRVCKENLSYGWTPGKNNGEVVTCSFSLPVMFRLQ